MGKGIIALEFGACEQHPTFFLLYLSIFLFSCELLIKDLNIIFQLVIKYPVCVTVNKIKKKIGII